MTAQVELKSDLARRKASLLLVVGDRTVTMERLEEFDAEDDLLRTQAQINFTELALPEVSLFAGFAPADVTAITAYMKRKTFDPGAVVFREGDAGDEVLIVTKGTASAYLQAPGRANIRLATFAPGTVFGELAILDRGPRSASVIADGELVCYGLSSTDYALLAEKSPPAAIQFMAAIGRELSGRLRTANRTIHQLEM